MRRPTFVAELVCAPFFGLRLGLGLALAVVAPGFAFARLVACKGGTFAQSCALHGVRASPLLPVPESARGILAGAALSVGFWLQVIGEPTLGAICIAVATLLAASCAPPAKPRPRGPGRWQELCPAQAFASKERGKRWLDMGSRMGCRSASACIGSVVLGAALVRTFARQCDWMVMLDAAPLVPLFVTGCRSQLPPHLARSASVWLARVYVHLRNVNGLRVSPLARVSPTGGEPDELRLLIQPTAAMAGVVGFELGLAWTFTPVCWVPTPEVLARVLDGSAAAAKLARSIPRLRSMPGRRPEERVIRLLPRLPTRSSTVALVGGLAATLTERRADSVAAQAMLRML